MNWIMVSVKKEEGVEQRQKLILSGDDGDLKDIHRILL